MEVLTEYWLTIGIGIFLLAMVLYGHYIGFIRLAVSMTALILTAAIVWVLAPKLTVVIKEETNLDKIITENLQKSFDLSELSGSEMEIPAGQRMFIEGLNLPEQLKELLIENNNREVYERLGVHAFIDYLFEYLSNMVINGICYVVLFFIIMLAFRFCMRWLDLVARLPILNGINRIAGAVLGGVEGLAWIWFLFMILTICSGFEWAWKLLQQIEGSPFLLFLYRNNIFSFIGKFVL